MILNQPDDSRDAHVHCRWKEGHVAERSAIPYPDRIVDYAEQEFRKMKTRQAELLGISNGRIRSKL